MNLKYDHDTRQLEKLQKTNVYNDTFYIVNEGHFGTINGFRLGYLPTQRVSLEITTSMIGEKAGSDEFAALEFYNICKPVEFFFIAFD